MKKYIALSALVLFISAVAFAELSVADKAYEPASNLVSFEVGSLANSAAVYDGAVNDSLSGLQAAIGLGLAVSFNGMTIRADVGTDLLGAGLAYAF